jgi:hypothetical protein
MRRSAAFSPAMVAFLAGLIVAAVAMPSYDDSDSTTLDTGVVSGQPESDPTLTEGVTAGDAAATVDGGAAQTGGATRKATGATGGGGTTAAASAARNVFRGVTDKTIKIGMPTLDASNEAVICPRCTTGDAARGAAQNALLKAWRRDGLLPVHGRDIVPVFYSYDPLDPTAARSTCVKLGQEDKVFAAIEVNMPVSECLARDYKTPVIVNAAATDAQLRSFNGYVHNTQASSDRRSRNFPHFLKDNGFLRPETVIGIYGPAGYGERLEPQLKKLGFKVAVNMVYDTGNTAASDPVAVQRFRAAGVNVAVIQWYIGEPAGFQNAAEAQGYRPKYPTMGTGADALIDVFYNADSQNGNVAMDDVYLGLTSRKPVHVSSKAGEYCIKEYQAYTGKPLDGYDNDTEIRFVLSTCEMLEVMRQALLLAGPTLTDQTFIAAVHSIKGLPTSQRLSQTFGNRFDGSDGFTTVLFKKDGSCRPAPIKFCETGPPRLYPVP